MWLCRFLTLVLGGILIFYSLLWVIQEEIVLFDAYMAIASPAFLSHFRWLPVCGSKSRGKGPTS